MNNLANRASVSVIICTYNRRGELSECLRSLAVLKTAVLEVIVVDNHSSDNTLEMLKADYPECVLIANPGNFGTAYARNQAIKIARGDSVWFLDSDTVIPHADVLDNLLSFFREHPDTGSLGGQIIQENGTLCYWVMLEDRSLKIPMEPGPVHQFTTQYLATCNCMVPRKWLVKMGGFDLHYFYYCEDIDLGMRLNRMGLKNVFRSDCAVVHHFAQKERTSTYYLFFRNQLRCLISNQSAYHLFLFPFTQLQRVISHYLALRKEPDLLAKIKTINAGEKKKYQAGFGIAKLGATIVSAIAGAALWNFFHLLPTLYYRWHAPDYLERTRI